MAVQIQPAKSACGVAINQPAMGLASCVQLCCAALGNLISSGAVQPSSKLEEKAWMHHGRNGKPRGHTGHQKKINLCRSNLASAEAAL